MIEKENTAQKQIDKQIVPSYFRFFEFEKQTLVMCLFLLLLLKLINILVH